MSCKFGFDNWGTWLVSKSKVDKWDYNSDKLKKETTY